jgi:hypothetical protein
VTNVEELAAAVLETAANGDDQVHLADPCVIERTMFVDTSVRKGCRAGAAGQGGRWHLPARGVRGEGPLTPADRPRHPYPASASTGWPRSCQSGNPPSTGTEAMPAAARTLAPIAARWPVRQYT